MPQKVHFVTIAAADLDAVREFYTVGLDWVPLVDVAGEVVFYQAGPGVVLGFFEASKFAEDTGLDQPPAVSGVTLSHNVDSEMDVRTFVRAMERAGGQIMKEAQPGAFGGIFHAQVRDPNGLVWEIAHNPGWRVEGDGRVVFG